MASYMPYTSLVHYTSVGGELIFGCSLPRQGFSILRCIQPQGLNECSRPLGPLCFQMVAFECVTATPFGPTITAGNAAAETKHKARCLHARQPSPPNWGPPAGAGRCLTVRRPSPPAAGSSAAAAPWRPVRPPAAAASRPQTAASRPGPPAARRRAAPPPRAAGAGGAGIRIS